MLCCWNVCVLPLGHVSSPPHGTTGETKIAFGGRLSSSGDAAFAGKLTAGGNGGGVYARPVAAGLVNSNTSPTIAKIATIPNNKMLTSFLSVMATTSFS